MNFCTKCGSKIESGTLFCTNCGQPLSGKPASTQSTPVSTAASVQSTVQNSNSVNSISNKIKSLNKTQKIAALSAAGALLLLFILFKIGASLTSRDKVVTKFNEALTAKNSSQLAKYIVSSDSKLKIDSKNIDALLSYIDKNPSYKNEITKSIQNQSDAMEVSSKSGGNSKEASATAKSNANANDLFTLKKQGKTWLFFDKYVLEVSPVYVRVQTNYKDTKVYLGDTEVCTADKNDFTKEVGPYFPGMYKMKAVLKGDYVNLEKALDVDLVRGFDSSNKEQKLKLVSLYLDGYEVSLDSDYDDAKLLVNGKDTGLLIKDAQKFGPVSKDGSVKLSAQKEFPWGVVKGEEVAVTGSWYVYLKLSGVNDELKTSLMDTVNTYNKSWVEAIKARDSSKLVNVSERKIKNADDYFKTLINYKDMYSGSITKTVYDLDSMRIYKRDNKYYAELTDKETYNSSWYKDGGTAPQATLEEPCWQYTLVYDEANKKWLVDESYKTYYFSPKNPKEFTF